MKCTLTALIAILALSSDARAQDPDNAFGGAAGQIRQRLEESVAELNQLRERAAAEKIPLSRKLAGLESELSRVRGEFRETTRLLDSRALDLANLRNEIESRRGEAIYLSNLLDEYNRNFESRLHIAEMQRYRGTLEEAKLALEDNDLSPQEAFEAQLKMLSVSLDRLENALGGDRFEGAGVAPDGLVKNGAFVIAGPAAVFLSEDGEVVGTAEQRLGSLEPAIAPFSDPQDAEAAKRLVETSSGHFPLDPTLGNAHKIERTGETLMEHIQKGGPVMIPIFALAGAAFLVAVFKWSGMAFVRAPSNRKMQALLDAVARNDFKDAKKRAKSIGGPVGKMLTAGAEHLGEPRELIEEVMYEKMLESRLILERYLPFIAISAASAPLLGLLGTVTGIINTFKLITVFGSGDVKTLSGGISEALITTEFGLIVAIPSLMLHALLSRRARGIVNRMEKAAVAFVNQVAKTKPKPEEKTGSGHPRSGGRGNADGREYPESAAQPLPEMGGGGTA